MNESKRRTAVRSIMMIMLLAVVLSGVYAESAAAETIGADELLEWNQRRTGIQKTGMIVLGSWAAANFAVSGFYMTRTSDRDFYFHQMNVFWNVVNLGIAGFGYIGAAGSPLDLALAETIHEFRSFSRILAINAALDVGYVMAGFYLKSRGNQSEQHMERLIGYGNSIILQGSFLFTFDVVLALINRSAVLGLADAAAVELTAIPGGIGARFSW